MFTPYFYKQLVVKCDYVLQQVQTLSCCNSNNNKYFFSSIISYHFIHSLLMTHFTSNLLHIKDSMCLLHIRLQLFTITPIFVYYNYTRKRVKWGTGPMKHWLPFLINTNPFKSQKILFNKRLILRYTYF